VRLTTRNTNVLGHERQRLNVPTIEILEERKFGNWPDIPC
jgi:hypothetical protein